MTHAARGLDNFATKSDSELAPIAPSFSRAVTASAFTSKATQVCPSRIRRRTMFAPIPRGPPRRVASGYPLALSLSPLIVFGCDRRSAAGRRLPRRPSTLLGVRGLPGPAGRAASRWLCRFRQLGGCGGDGDGDRVAE